MCIYERLKQLSVELPESTAPSGSYTTMTEFGGRYLCSAGTGCASKDKPLAVGRLGREVTLEEGRNAARQCVLNVLANAEGYLGDLNLIGRVVKTTVYVASEGDFGSQSLVAEGASELLKDLFGPQNLGVRCAIGVSSLPKNQAVEIEVVFEMNGKGRDAAPC